MEKEKYNKDRITDAFYERRMKTGGALKENVPEL